MDLQLKDKTAFVSGSSKGIGKAIAESLLNEGTHVIINGRSTETLSKVENELREKYVNAQISSIAADFSKADEVNKLIDKLPSIDILINNVGIFEPRQFEEILDEDWFRFFEVNVLSGVRLSRHVLSGMREKNWGRILFISSESAINIPEEMVHYGMTKTAQLAISRGLAELTKGTDITVNTLLPGPTSSDGILDFLGGMAKENDMSEEAMKESFFNSVRPTSLLQRFARVDEVANMAVFLSSPLSSATNGSAIRVDGGVVKSIY